MVKPTHRRCNKCNKVFKLGKAVNKYIEKYPKNIACPHCGFETSHIIHESTYKHEKNLIHI